MPEPQDILERMLELGQDWRAGEAEALAEGLTGEPRRRVGLGGAGLAAVPAGRSRRRLRTRWKRRARSIPLDLATRSILAECFARTGHPELARHVYEAIAAGRADPEMPPRRRGGAWATSASTASALRRLPGTGPSRTPRFPRLTSGWRSTCESWAGRPHPILPIVARAHELAPAVPLYRVSLATLLDHVGRRDEARDLLAGLDLDAVSCRCCVQRMSTIFLPAGRRIATAVATRPRSSRPDPPDRRSTRRHRRDRKPRRGGHHSIGSRDAGPLPGDA